MSKLECRCQGYHCTRGARIKYAHTASIIYHLEFTGLPGNIITNYYKRRSRLVYYALRTDGRRQPKKLVHCDMSPKKYGVEGLGSLGELLYMNGKLCWSSWENSHSCMALFTVVGWWSKKMCRWWSKKMCRLTKNHGSETLSIRGQVFAQNLSFSTKSTFFWICKIPDSVETSKSNFKSKFCWHSQQGPRASKKGISKFPKNEIEVSQITKNTRICK